MTDLVLTRPGASSSAERHWSHLPLGIGYLAARARQQGLTVAIVDAKILKHSSVQQTAEATLAHNPRLVGISALTVEFASALKIATLLKGHHAPPTVVLGGAHANALPKESLTASEHLDYVIAGEAETSLATLTKHVCSGTQPEGIPGLYCRDSGNEIIVQAPVGFREDVATLPFPAWDLFPRSTVYPMMTERGCPYECVFCSRNMSRKVRSRPLDNVTEEIRWLHRDFAPDEIHIEDETFGLHKERTYEFLAWLADFNRDKGIQFKAQTRVDTLTPRMAAMMKNAGFGYVELGVESGDADVLARSKKGYSPSQAEIAVKTLSDAGIKAWVNFIIGLPGETRESIRHSIELASRLNPNRLSVAIIVAYPGSEIYQWAVSGQNGYHLLTRDWQRFDKYLTSSVEIDGLSYGTMRRYQFQMYAETYLRNRRIRDLAMFAWKNRSFVRPFLNSLTQKERNIATP